MKKRHPNPRLVKIHRSYTVEEIAKRFGIHKNTVRHWIKEGLAAIIDKRPMLIQGIVLAEFLGNRRKKNKQPCKPGELYCVRCRAPKLPAANMADYRPITEKFGNLVAICPDCNTLMNRNVSLAKIGEFQGKVDISFPEALKRIGDRDNPSVNSDLTQETSEHAKIQRKQ
ncbi:MAG TPA: helix-turn-helix domain-containing protein [Smithella sp.]|jgi:Zn-finger protein|nr:helix-turn-helix domain-containing protein [Smithella sp.]